tara:strand:- start:135 stop:392 length:258 start_codon:yes stop_codon:yes gene_type:complete
MNITKHIVNDFKPLTTQSTVKEAIKLCKTFPITHIPIIENTHYIGSISQADVLTIYDKEELLKESFAFFSSTKVNPSEFKKICRQ